MNKNILSELKCWMSWMMYMDRFFPGSLDRIVSVMKCMNLCESLQLSDEMEFLPVSCIDPRGEIIQCLQAALELLSSENREAERRKLLVLFDPA